ncbi:lipolytic protein G-D-S-L family [Thioalkalivibrio sp. K90mix]|uniref:GDSL-type esterase/lipase family protein n=1 Tax=Thioalkalivibrio sp. (strain K90mix) TaxID=396595 RepID=UPI0001959547|nr:GDSL-type esterase/lipase family protein [Thioalkalivibrio sp. K90mix]ADC72602.1 lipolytic protein G-D-S-L family [Thioalkalivibrio sp. K90mix]
MIVSSRRIFLAGGLAGLLALLAGCGGSGPGDLEPLPRSATVLAFGDSVTHGTGASRGEDFPARLSEITGWQVVNEGVPGDRADTARTRLGRSLREHDPDLVIIGLGGNDFLRQRAASAVKEDLRALIHEVREHGAQPLLLGVPSASAFAAATGRLRDDGLYGELAREEGVPLIGAVLSDVLSSRDLRADRIHPNAAGYQQMAEQIADGLEELGLWLAP